MRLRFSRLLEGFLTVFGDIKVFKWPLFLIYEPTGYRVKGHHTREVMERILPGDILVRGYRSYLDGHFIPGYFSHVGLYLGEVTEADRSQVPDKPAARKRFAAGKQIVIHALAEGVLMEDLINFCRCDDLVVLRLPRTLTKKLEALPPDYQDLKLGDDDQALGLFSRLMGGDEVSFEEAWTVARREALSRLGDKYDFQFDFTDFRALSCSELVFFAYRAISPFLSVFPRATQVFLWKKILLRPDAFVSSPLEVVYVSPSVDGRKLRGLRPEAGEKQQAAAAKAA